MKKYFGFLCVGIIIITLSGCELFPQDEVVDQDQDQEKTAGEIVGYTEDQEKVIDNFGEPDEFTVTLNVEDDPKVETWKYFEIEKVFVFKDGKYDDAYSVSFGLPEDQVYLNAKIHPEDIYGLENIDDLEDLLGIEASGVMDVDDQVWENAKYYDFGGVVSAATIDDQLVFVKTQSQVSPYKWDELEEKVEEEIAEGPGGEREGMDTFEVDLEYGFTLDLPERWSDFDYLEEEDDVNMIANITFLMPTSDTEYSADGYVSMFIVTAYYRGTQDQVSPFETVIGKNNEFLYTFSHMNGIPPADLEGHVRDFEQIRNSIELYDL